ncbi:unnamed protein product [Onchocerca flexuosa]|uniref:VWFA domain-containing protein n=1 Tax=Onchocerca flexuosa TaxID=387005 RepID=A0A183H1M0_9BILA|nr:unnamed protein product [Onchocerca flexuosa]
MTMSSIQYFWLILLLRTVKYSKPCVDVVFVLDGSASVKQHFQQMINMAGNMAKQFDIDKRGHRIAILEFSSKAIFSKWLRYPFDQFKVISVQSFIFYCNHMKYFPSEYHMKCYRDSEEVQQNVANLVDKPNVQLFVATASKPYNVQGLLVLVGNDSSHIVTNASFLNISRKILKPYSECLDSRTDFIRKKITSLPTATNNTFSTLSFATAATKHRINRLSGTLSEFVFRQVRFASTLPIKPVDAAAQSLVSTMTTKSILTKLNIKPGYSMIISQWPRYIILARNEHLRYFISVKLITSEGAIKDLHQAPSNGGTIRTGEAICYAVHEFNEKFGARKGARKMMVIFTNGYSQISTSFTIFISIFHLLYASCLVSVFRESWNLILKGEIEDNPIKASQLAHSKGIELKALSVADENVPPDTEQIISITGNPSVCIIFKLLNYIKLVVLNNLKF